MNKQGKLYIKDFSEVYGEELNDIFVPKTIEEVQEYVKNAPGQICIGGAQCSQGGQIMCKNGNFIDTRELNKIVEFIPDKKCITVQTGTKFGDIQECIDPYNLSVGIMQSYKDFTVGGTLSVNAHGRNLKYGQFIESVVSFRIVLSDGTLLEANRDRNYDVFRATAGGYGGIGVIVTITLLLTPNVKIERTSIEINASDFSQFFREKVLNNEDRAKIVNIFNMNLYPPNFTEGLIAIYTETEKDVTDPTRLKPVQKFYPYSMVEEQIVRRVPPVNKLRPKVEKKRLCDGEVVWLNNEMSSTINTLRPLSKIVSTTILQEYFIPVENFDKFMDMFRKVILEWKVNLINLSVRYVPGNTESYLTYAPVNSYSFVLYINVFNNRFGLTRAEKWTRELIDIALKFKGRYYLPYHLFAQNSQFIETYGKGISEYLAVKFKVDPNGKFTNNFLIKYLTPDNI